MCEAGRDSDGNVLRAPIANDVAGFMSRNASFHTVVEYVPEYVRGAELYLVVSELFKSKIFIFV